MLNHTPVSPTALCGTRLRKSGRLSYGRVDDAASAADRIQLTAPNSPRRRFRYGSDMDSAELAVTMVQMWFRYGSDMESAELAETSDGCSSI